MTRCVYLTFFGEYRGHGEPHESPRAITVPLIVLAGFSVVAGFANATALEIEKFTEWVEPTVAFPALEHPEFELAGAALALAVALLGVLVSYAYWFRNLGPQGLTARNPLARAGYRFLENKYYLDALYENVIVASIKGAIARASYWVNQKVIDGAVNGLGTGAAQVGRFAYDVVDQKGVDGAVNGIAVSTGEAGGLLRYVQSGRVQRYALLLFGAVALLSLALYILN
jgi:NADH-quinone oxidoreductase subunit L